ncbi:MAG TPA: hypothetical protein VNO70_22875 [Blastocatellia bacterium]|nr:hypothetical protein [Blastocatellia bacterium]
MTTKMSNSRRIARRAIALLALLVAATALSTRLRADIETTGTCGGASITIPFS